MGIRPLMIDISTVVDVSATDETVPTTLAAWTALQVENTWDRDATGTPYLIPRTITDEIGTSTVRITKGWFTDAELTNMPTVGGTSINANAVLNLTSAEVSQLANISTETIETTQWSILGNSNQGIAKTSLVTFAQVTVDNLILNDNLLSTSTGNLDLKAVSGTGLVRILDNNGVPVFSYNNASDIFTFSDTVTIDIGNELKVNTINTYNSVNGVTIENIQLNSGDMKVDKISELTGSAGVDIESINVTDSVITMTNSADYIINCVRATSGDGNDFILNGADGIFAGGTPEDAGDIIFSTGAGVSGGQDGEIYLKINDVTKFQLDATKASFAGYINQTGIFAEIYVADASTAQSIATGAGYTKSTAFTTNGQSSNCSASSTDDRIIITQLGKYRVSGTCSAISGTANVTWRGAAFLNSVEQDQVHWKRKMTTNTDAGSMSFTGFIDVTTVPWSLDFRLRHDNGGAVDFTIEYANLNVEYVGAT